MDFFLRSPADLLKKIDAETGLLTRIRSSSEAKPEVFENYWQPLIDSVAEYVQECPFEQVSFSEPGGLLRYALMAGYYALQIGNQQFFTGKHGAEKRRILVPQYRFAVFFSTLAGIPATLHARMIVRAGEKTWTPFSAEPALSRWVRAQNANTFNIEWRLSELKVSPANAVAWSADIVGIGTWQNLAEEVAMLAHDAIYQVDPKTGESPVTTCVRQAYRTAREFETRAMTGRYQTSALPESVTPEAIQKFGEGLETTTAGSKPTASPTGQSDNTQGAAQISSTSPAEQADVPAAAASTSADVQPGSPDTKKAPSTPRYPDIVLDIFKAIRHLDDYDQIKKSCNEIEKGIAVPISIFAKHGLPVSKVLDILDQSKLLVEISPTRKSCILQKAARGLLFG
ncbi:MULTISPECIES: TraI domain-containing protein [unclassified Cupriavidus]|uniref:TraI domain-containing protein n=1 Tax=unclassified Cupriavidus TaxID=2640874 RepID=UPI001AE7E047|nr:MULTISPECIES: TraI domain-containing protein [unclassified Cupriavidus]MBP0633118.1 TraI domain-containing protein [Cupriavidus sp. AcVe19-1a]MBP0639796.1 TraI domain-containing protein [Cupriavidus sp. AcVe19-6a]